MECNHERREFRKLSFERGGKPTFHKVYQCMECGRKIPHGQNNGCWWPHDEGDENLPEFDVGIVDAWHEKSSSAIREKIENENAQKRSEFRSKHREYEIYINTSQDWQARRAKVLKRAAFTCESCLEAKATQVHHLNYDSLFNEVLYDLRAVCRDCHQKIHNVVFAKPQPFD